MLILKKNVMTKKKKDEMKINKLKKIKIKIKFSGALLRFDLFI